MRLYDGRAVHRFLDRRFKSHVTSRDAIVWDYDDAAKTVRCKIQGSNEYIVCHYPRNFRTKEEWCKRGNAIRIEHKGGVKGYLEVVGHGRAIPSPVSGPAFPVAEPLADVVLSGGSVEPFVGMTVDVGATTYRIDGMTYSINQGEVFIVMGDAQLGDMGSPGSPVMGASLNQYIEISAAPDVGLFRYDLLVAGIDGDIDVIVGDEAASNPVMPTVPADHIKIAHIFLIGGMTEITLDHINTLWESRRLSTLDVVYSNGTGTIQNEDEFLWHDTNNTPYVHMTVTFKDQYGWNFTGSRETRLSLLLGSGGISGTTSGFGTSDVLKTSTGATVSFYYQRNQLASPEHSPYMSLTIDAEGGFASTRIQLLDVDEGEIP